MAVQTESTDAVIGKGNTVTRLVCSALLLIHAILAFDSLRQHNVTVDEGGHLLSGVLAWDNGRFDVYPVNPPLIKAILSLPIAASHPEIPEDCRSVDFPNWCPLHQQFMKANQHRYQDLLVRARCFQVILSLMTGWLIYRWSCELFGVTAGLTALSLWTLCPNVLAWSGVCTVDLGASAFGMAAMYSLRYYFRRPHWLSALGAGTMLGLALLAKFTLLILVPVWLLLWLTAVWQRSHATVPPGIRPRWLDFPLVFCTSVLVINAGYGFQGTGRRLGDFPFRCHALTHPIGETRVNRFRTSWLEQLPIPLPEAYVAGLDEQKSQADISATAYLRGQWQKDSWWYFLVYVLAVKLPLGTLILISMSLLLTLRSHRFRSPYMEELFLWLPASGVFLLLSAQTGLHWFASPRYLLPLFPFLFVGISRVGKVLEFSWPYRSSTAICCHLRISLCAAVALAALAWNAASALRVHPHYLSYFNELAGGPDRGWEHLIESNIDWGQDLLFLEHWCNDHPEANPLGIACYATIKPRLNNVICQPIPYGPDTTSRVTAWLMQGPRPGWYAVSVNLVCGARWTEWDERGGRLEFPRNAFRYFRFFTPIAKAGYSIFIYHITLEEANRVRSQIGLPPLIH